jgi:hypothetical protein
VKSHAVLTALCVAGAFAVVCAPARGTGATAYVSVPEAAGTAEVTAGGESPAAVVVDSFVALEPQLASPAGAVACPKRATCLTLPGTFFTATTQEPFRIYKVLVPTGKRFRRLETSFKFRHGGWNEDPRGIFTLVYLNRNGKFRGNTYAVVDIAQQQRRVHVELTADLPAVGPPEGVQNERQKVLLVPGQTYDVKYVYDAENLRFHLTMTDAKGKKVVDLSEPIQATTRVVRSKGSFWIQFSEPITESLHKASLGWSHSDLVFALIP